ncbi:hypothetical protein D3C81_1815170 [compost metagenome]
MAAPVSSRKLSAGIVVFEAVIMSAVIAALYRVTAGVMVVVAAPPVATGAEAVAETNNLISDAAM